MDRKQNRITMGNIEKTDPYQNPQYYKQTFYVLSLCAPAKVIINIMLLSYPCNLHLCSLKRALNKQHLEYLFWLKEVIVFAPNRTVLCLLCRTVKDTLMWLCCSRADNT